MTHTFCGSFAGCVYHAPPRVKKILDWTLTKLYIIIMPKHIIKVDKSTVKFRLTIPKQIIKDKGWLTVSHVLVEDHWGDRIVIRRLMNEEDPKKKDS